jgi:hypothetical protein
MFENRADAMDRVVDGNMSLLDGPTTCNWLEVAALLRRRPGERIARLGFARQSRKYGRCVMPTWRAEYFDSAKDEVPSRIEIIEAEYEADALVEARSKMSSNCSRAEVTRFDPPRASVVSLLRFLKASLPLQF